VVDLAGFDHRIEEVRATLGCRYAQGRKKDQGEGMTEHNLIDRIYHPLLGVELPTLPDLAERCDDQAGAVLLAAGRLAAYRGQCIVDLKQAYIKYQQPPSPTRSLDIDRLEEPYVTETDAVRALLALYADHLKALLFKSREQKSSQFWHASEEFFDSADHWQRELRNMPATTPPQTIEKRWARRWAMAILEDPQLRIDIPSLIVSLLHAFPPGWLDVYCEGLITREEAYNWYVRKAADDKSKGRPLPRVPAAYIDRHDCLSRIEQALRHAPGVFIVAEQPVMRKRIVDVLTANIPYHPRFRWALAVGSPPFGDIGKHILEQGFQGAVFALTGDDLSQNREVPESTDSSPQPIVDRLELFRGLVALKPAHPFNFAVAMSPSEHRALLNMVPESASVPMIKLPASDNKDLLLEYLSYLPFYQDRKKVDLGLGLLLDFLSGREAPAECFALASIPHFVHRLSSGQEDLGLDVPRIPLRPWELPSTEPVQPHSYAEQVRRPFAFVERKIHVRATRRELKRMLKTAGDFFAEYIGDTEDLTTLVGIYHTLAHLKKSDSFACNYIEAGSVAELLGRPD
jgi:hypothetical protein